MRKILYNKYDPNKREYREDFSNEGLFHQWIKKRLNSIGDYTYAIIENPDGTMIEIGLDFVKFKDETQRM